MIQFFIPSFHQLCQIWWRVQILMAISFVIYRCLSLIFNKSEKAAFNGAMIKIFLLSFILPWTIFYLPQNTNVSPIKIHAMEKWGQVWNINQNKLAHYVIPKIKASSQNLSLSHHTWLSYESLNFYILASIFLLGLFIWLCLRFKDYFIIKNIIKDSILIKKQNRIQILLNTKMMIPFSFRGLKNIYVVIPEDLIAHPQNFQLALKHEFQHHRQGDTLFIYFLELIIGLCFFNPFVHLWSKEIHAWQEFRCDQKLLHRSKLCQKSYAQCLIDVATLNKYSSTPFAGAKAMASLNAKTLQRRIEMIVSQPQHLVKAKSFYLKLSLCLFLTCMILLQVSYAQRMGPTLKEWSAEEVSLLAKKLSASKIPVDSNALVVKWLNYFLNTKEGKVYVIKAKSGMLKYQKMVQAKLEEENMPLELLAVPFMESGFNNFVTSSQKARGLWQFIPATARRYGLKVNQKVDERLDAKKSTVAALQYYRHLLDIEEFKKDWRLALLAYNTGESALVKAMKKKNSSNPWDFSDLGDHEYLAKIMAGILIVSNPQIISLTDPVPWQKISSPFGKRSTVISGEHFHEGVDLPQKQGEEVHAPISGLVIKASEDFHGTKSYGKVLVINHGKDIQTRYFHLQDFEVKDGDYVEEGQVIGHVGSTGISSGPHLHFELRIHDAPVDPMKFLQTHNT